MRAALLAGMLLACGKHASQLQFVDVKRDDLVIGVDVEGELAATDSTDIHPPQIPDVWDFKIAMMANEGDNVKAGQPVVGFDPSNLMRDLENMRNEADAAQKKLDKKRDDVALTRRDDELKILEAESALKKAKLRAEGSSDLIATAELQQLKLDAENAQLVLDGAKFKAAQTKASDDREVAQLTEKAAYAKHRVETLMKSLGEMEIKAPRDGTVVVPTFWNGEKKKVGDGAYRGETVAMVVSLAKMRGKGTIDEVDLARVATKQSVRLRLDAQPDVELRGTVSDIEKTVGPHSQQDPSKVAKLAIELAPTQVPLRPGMRFRGQVETELLPKVVQVPTEAVFVRADGPVAFRDTGHGTERVKIVLGKRSKTMIEVTSGLSPGDRVSRIDPEAAK